MKLGQMTRGQRGNILRIEGPDAGLVRRFMEMGLIEGSSLELVHEAPFGGDPIAVRVRGGLIALRRHEANWVEVQLGAGGLT